MLHFKVDTKVCPHREENYPGELIRMTTGYGYEKTTSCLVGGNWPACAEPQLNLAEVVHVLSCVKNESTGVSYPIEGVPERIFYSGTDRRWIAKRDFHRVPHWHDSLARYPVYLFKMSRKIMSKAVSNKDLFITGATAATAASLYYLSTVHPEGAEYVKDAVLSHLPSLESVTENEVFPYVRAALQSVTPGAAFDSADQKP